MEHEFRTLFQTTIKDGLRVFLLGALVGMLVSSLVSMFKTIEIATKSGFSYFESELTFAQQEFRCGTGLVLLIMPAVIVAVCIGVWFLYLKLRDNALRGIASGLFMGALVSATATVAGFFVLHVLCATPAAASFYSLTFLDQLIYTAPAGALSGGSAFWLYWQTRGKFRTLNKVPAFFVFPLLVGLCSMSILSALPQTKVNFFGARWRDEIHERPSMFPDLLMQHPLKGENILDVEQLLGPSEVPDSSSNKHYATDNYYWGPNSMLQVTYDKNTKLITGYAINTNFFPAAKNRLVQVPLPEMRDTHNVIVDWTKGEPEQPATIKYNGKTFESAYHRQARLSESLEKFGLRLWFTPIAELQNGQLFVCDKLSNDSKSAPENQTWIIDPKTGKPLRGPDMQCARTKASLLTLRDGRVLIVGGYHRRRISPACELFDPATHKISNCGSLLLPRAGAGLAQLSNGDVLVASGWAPEGLEDQEGMTTTVELIHFGSKGVEHLMIGTLARARSEPDVLPLGNNSALIVSGDLGQSQRFKSHRGADLFSDTFANASFQK